MLAFYLDRINTKKDVVKYFKDVIDDENIEKYADLILEYLDHFKPRFVENLKKQDKKIAEYIESKNKIN